MTQTNTIEGKKKKTTMETPDDLAFLESIKNLPALEKFLRCNLRWGNGVSQWELLTNKK